MGGDAVGWRRSPSSSLFPSHLGFGVELLITILFALSLDLALGYAGIVTLGHAAFFGVGAYTVGMLAKYGIWTEPISGLLIAAAAAAIVGLVSGFVLLRTTGLTLLMLTMCTMLLLEEAANLGHDWTGGFDGLDGVDDPAGASACSSSTRSIRPTQYLYALAVLVVGFVVVRTIVYSPFGQSLTGIRENTLRMHAVGAPVNARLITCYTISAAIAGVAGAVWAQANAYVNLSHARPRSRGDGADHPGARRLWPALRRVHRRDPLHGAVALPGEGLSGGVAARPRAAADGDRPVRAQRRDRHLSRLRAALAARAGRVMSQRLSRPARRCWRRAA